MDDANLYDEIAMVARDLYEKSGRVGGRDLENWLEAENIVKARWSLIRKHRDEASWSGGRKYEGDEKRRYKRFPITGTRIKFLHSSKVKIIDISVGGAAIEATKKLEINKGYRLHINHKGSSITLEGRMVWSVLARQEKRESGDIIMVYKGGMQFHKSLLANPFL
jgi:hypothetical protein